MRSFPVTVSPKAPPIKSQGIKTKLAPFILSSFRWDGAGRWVEPFVGSGAVAFNAAPERALLADSNKHIIRFYQAIQAGELTAEKARDYFVKEGAKLLQLGGDHYYAVRTRFNAEGNPLDFLFLSRECFNGVMRFNSKGGFNVPFCKKPDRFRQAYVTKICNQIRWVSTLMSKRKWTFVHQDWRQTLSQVAAKDFAYIDPPYVGRHTDYFNSWDETAADDLAKMLRELSCGFAYSMWSKNKYRENEHLKRWFSDFAITTFKHFYHVGSTENLRNEMEEALVITPRFAVERTAEKPAEAAPQLALL
jgi:DNA adenine methylase